MVDWRRHLKHAGHPPRFAGGEHVALLVLLALAIPAVAIVVTVALAYLFGTDAGGQL